MGNLTVGFNARLLEVLPLFLVSLVLARTLGPNQYGAFAFSVSFIAFCSFPATAGIEGNGLGKFVPEAARGADALPLADRVGRVSRRRLGTRPGAGRATVAPRRSKSLFAGRVGLPRFSIHQVGSKCERRNDCASVPASSDL
jgi:hypothetical protein